MPNQHTAQALPRALAFEQRWIAAVRDGLKYADLARALDYTSPCLGRAKRRTESVLGRKLPSFGSEVRSFEIASERLTDEDELPIEELVARRLRDTERSLKRDKTREYAELKLHCSGPFGIALIGDPHMDSPGCNLGLLKAHTETILATDGMYAICVGDLQDGWVGRLARLWAQQGIKARDSQRLVDWWLKLLSPKLLALIEGNHDAWLHGVNTLSPVAWIESRAGTVVENHGIRLRCVADDGAAVTINARHDFPGRSQYNTAHGPMKSGLFGFRDDCAVAGHTHEFGYGVRLDPETRKPMHAVRLGSYKHSDDYARERGFLDGNVSECSVLMVDRSIADPRHQTWIETDLFRAARILTMLRGEHGRSDRTGRRSRNHRRSHRG